MLLLADISGYTAFLHAVGAAHEAEMVQTGVVPPAYPLMTTLLDGIVEALVPPFTLSKTEGDAVFAFAADADLTPHGAAILEYMDACYHSFRQHVRTMNAAMTCSCDACTMGIKLDLKFVMHHGGYVAQPIAGRLELLGPDVNAVHRLLKNGAADVMGTRAYALLTEAAATHLEVSSEPALRLTERYEHLDPIETLVFPMPIHGSD